MTFLDINRSLHLSSRFLHLTLKSISVKFCAQCVQDLCIATVGSCWFFSKKSHGNAFAPSASRKERRGFSQVEEDVVGFAEWRFVVEDQEWSFPVGFEQNKEEIRVSDGVTSMTRVVSWYCKDWVLVRGCKA